MTKPSRFSRAAKLILILFSILVSSCAQAEQVTPTPATPTPPGRALTWEKITDQVWGKTDDEYNDIARIELIVDSKEAQVLEGQVYPEVVQEVQGVDFSVFFVVAVFQGWKGSTGHSVEVIDVRQEPENNSITFYALFHEPAPEQVVGQAETSPYYILKVKKTGVLKGEFTFILNANGAEVDRQTQAIPS